MVLRNTGCTYSAPRRASLRRAPILTLLLCACVATAIRRGSPQHRVYVFRAAPRVSPPCADSHFAVVCMHRDCHSPWFSATQGVRIPRRAARLSAVRRFSLCSCVHVSRLPFAVVLRNTGCTYSAPRRASLRRAPILTLLLCACVATAIRRGSPQHRMYVFRAAPRVSPPCADSDPFVCVREERCMSPAVQQYPIAIFMETLR